METVERLQAERESLERAKKRLQGLRVSILGDSVSTYEGVSNDVAAQRALASNPAYYAPAFPLELTYWRLLFDKFGLQLHVNNSWSGAFVSEQFPGVGVDMEKTLSPGVHRVAYLMDNEGTPPQIILCFMGLNDLGLGVAAKAFAAAYGRMVGRMLALYPEADVFCVGLPDRYEPFFDRLQAYNGAIRAATQAAGERFTYVDLAVDEFRSWSYIRRSVDGLHPNVEGMQVIAEIIGRAFIDRYGKEEI